MNIIDRRPNPKGKSLANRQRFIERAKKEVKDAITDALKKRKLGDVDGGEKVSIPTRGISEPVFRTSSRGGKREQVLPGNKKFISGDQIERPSGGGGGGGRGEASAEDGGEQDAFEFMLSKEEFLDLLFEDLELPNLTKTKLKVSETMQLTRAGYAHEGTPANFSVRRTMRNSMARRISLHRPSPSEIEAMEQELKALEESGDTEGAAKLRLELETAVMRTKRFAYIDPVDVRYNRFDRIPNARQEFLRFAAQRLCLIGESSRRTQHHIRGLAGFIGGARQSQNICRYATRAVGSF